jgi:hypothetical protein
MARLVLTWAKGPGSIGASLARHVRFGRILHECPVVDSCKNAIRPLDFWTRIIAFDLGRYRGKSRRSLALPCKLWDAVIHSHRSSEIASVRRRGLGNAFAPTLLLASCLQPFSFQGLFHDAEQPKDTPPFQTRPTFPPKAMDTRYRPPQCECLGKRATKL